MVGHALGPRLVTHDHKLARHEDPIEANERNDRRVGREPIRRAPRAQLQAVGQERDPVLRPAAVQIPHHYERSSCVLSAHVERRGELEDLRAPDRARERLEMDRHDIDEKSVRSDGRDDEALVVTEAAREPAMFFRGQRQARQERMAVTHPKRMILAMRSMNPERQLARLGDALEVIDAPAEAARAIDLLQRDHVGVGSADHRSDRVEVRQDLPSGKDGCGHRPARTVGDVQGHDAE